MKDNTNNRETKKKNENKILKGIDNNLKINFTQRKQLHWMGVEMEVITYIHAVLRTV